MQNIIEFLKYENIKNEADLYREELHKEAEKIANFLVKGLRRDYESDVPIVSYDPDNTWFYYEAYIPRSIGFVTSTMGYSTTIPYFKDYLLSLIKAKCGFITDYIQFACEPFCITITDKMVILSFTINHIDYLNLDPSKVSEPLRETIKKIQEYHEQTQKEELYVHDAALWQPDIDKIVSDISNSLEDMSDWNLEVDRCGDDYKAISLFHIIDYDKSFVQKKQDFRAMLCKVPPPFYNRDTKTYHLLAGDLSCNINDYDPSDIDPNSFVRNANLFDSCIKKQIRSTLEGSSDPLIQEMMACLWCLAFNDNIVEEGLEISLRKRYVTKTKDRTYLMGVKFEPDEKLFKMAGRIVNEI